MALVIIGVIVWNFSTQLQTSQPLSFSEFMGAVDAGQIERVTIAGDVFERHLLLGAR